MSLTSRGAATVFAPALFPALLPALALAGAGALTGCAPLSPPAKPMSSDAGGTTDPGGQGGATGGDPNDPASYPHNTPGAAFPFPQGHAFAHCALPMYDA